MSECKYCREEVDEQSPASGKHHYSCPMLIEDGPERDYAIDEWQRGYDYGYQDNHPGFRCVISGGSTPYHLGWLIGYEDVDDAIQSAIESDQRRQWSD